MPGDAEEGIGIEMLPLVLSLAPCGGAGCRPRPPLPWRWGRPGTIAGPWAAGICQAALLLHWDVIIAPPLLKSSPRSLLYE